MEIYTIGGSEHNMPVQAMVIILLFPFPSVQDTITAGTGYNIVPGLS